MFTRSKPGSVRKEKVKLPSGPISRKEITNRANESAGEAKIEVLQEVQILPESVGEFQRTSNL